MRVRVRVVVQSRYSIRVVVQYRYSICFLQPSAFGTNTPRPWPLKMGRHTHQNDEPCRGAYGYRRMRRSSQKPTPSTVLKYRRLRLKLLRHDEFECPNYVKLLHKARPQLAVAVWRILLIAESRHGRRVLPLLPVFDFLGCFRAWHLPQRFRKSQRYFVKRPASSTVQRYYYLLLRLPSFERGVAVTHLWNAWPNMFGCVHFRLLAVAEWQRLARRNSQT